MRDFQKRFGKRIMYIASGLIAVIALIVFITNPLLGFGLTIAAAVPAAISEEQQAFLDVVKAEVSKLIEKNDKGYLSEAKLKIALDALELKFAGVIDADKMSELKGELKTLGENIEALKEKFGSAPIVKMTPQEAILAELKAAGITSIPELLKSKTSLTIKDATIISNADMTGTIGRSQIIGDVKFPRQRPFSFIGRIAGGIVAAAKNIIVWSVGTYTSNVGYAAEKTGGGADDAATGTEKTRKMSKIKAVLRMTAESFEDLPSFVSALIARMQSEAQLWIDQKIFDGTGNDATASTELYGIKTQGSTAFNPLLVPGVEKPNIGDLADGCALQASLNQYVVNTVRMSPGLAYQLRRTKDVNGQYVINRLLDGTMVMGGLTVIENTLFGNNEMLVSDDSLIQLWIKRGMEFKIGQFGTNDVENDNYTAVLFQRGQVLVEDNDKLGVIYVSNVTDALAAITAVPAV